MNLAATVGARIPHRRPDAMDFLAYWNATSVQVGGGTTLILDDSGHDIHVGRPTSSPEIIVAAAGVHGDSVFLPAYFNPYFAEQKLGTESLDPRLNFGNEPFTIGRWVKLEAPFQNDASARLLLGRWHTGPGGAFSDASYALFYNRTANRYHWAMSSNGTPGGSTAAFGPSMAAGAELNWHFLVGAYDGSTMHFWFDAGVPATAAHAGGAFAAADAYFSFDYRFGSTGGDNDVSAKVTVNSYFMSGFVLPRMITQEEVEFLYNSGSRLLYSETQFA